MALTARTLCSADEQTRARAVKKLSGVGSIGWKVFRFFLLCGLCFVLLYPLLYMLSISFRSMKDIYDPSVIWVSKHWTLDNFKEVIEVMDYKRALLTSLEINVVSSLIQVVICAVVGYGFARFEFKCKGLLFALVVLTVIVPPQLISTPLYIYFKGFDFFGIGSLVGLITGTPLTKNLLNTSWVFFLPAIFGQGIKSGLFIFIFRQFFGGMPRELEDAAQIDGCSFFGCFWRIMIPNVRSGMLVVVVLSLVWYWNDYFLGSMFISNHRTVMMELVNLPSGLRMFGGYESAATDPLKIITHMQAGSLLAIAPVLGFYILIQRFFIQGVERSGIVG